MQNTSDKAFRDALLVNVTKFALTTSRMIDVVMGVACTVEDTSVIEGGLSTKNKCLVSILFTGTIYGEYILSLDESLAAELIGVDTKTSNAPDDIEDAFRELLNVVVGESVVSLHEPTSKLTVTPPRVTFGSVRYPNFKTGRAVLLCDKGEIECFLYVDRMKLDITSSYGQALDSLQTAHAELQHAMTKLQAQQTYLVQSEKMAALGTMAAGVAHEINTPLATVSLIGEQIKEIVMGQPVDAPAVVRMLDTIDATIVRISKVTNGMRAFAHKAKGGKFAAAKFEDIFDHTMLACKKELADLGIDLRYVAPTEAVVFDCRWVDLTHVLLSLVSNARDAVASASQKWIQIDVQFKGEVVEIRVSDSGPGVSETIRGKIFDPFFTTKDIGQGVGLGLSVSKGIVDAHGGTIAVEAQAVSSFVVRLPRTQKQAA